MVNRTESKQMAQLIGISIDERTSSPWPRRQVQRGSKASECSTAYLECRDPSGPVTERPVSAEPLCSPSRWKRSLETDATCPINIHRLRHCAYYCRRLPFHGDRSRPHGLLVRVQDSKCILCTKTTVLAHWRLVDSRLLCPTTSSSRLHNYKSHHAAIGFNILAASSAALCAVKTS